MEGTKKTLTLFVNCLNELYRRQDVDLDKLSWAVGTQGYLKYFLNRIEDDQCSGEVIHECLARILANMIQVHLAIDKSDNGAAGFRREIERQLLADLSCEEEFHLEAVTFLALFHYFATDE